MTEIPNKPTKIEERFTYYRGKKLPLWGLLLVPFLFILLPLLKIIKHEINWKAAWLTVLTFEIILLGAEYYCLSRGHWVYNEARIFGPTIFGIPIEEPLLYYLFPPIFVIALFHLIRKKLSDRANLKEDV